LFALGFAPLAVFSGTTLLLLRHTGTPHRVTTSDGDARVGETAPTDSDATRGETSSHDIRTALDEAKVNEIFIAFGASLFAALMPCALLLFKTGLSPRVTATLAPLAALAGLPALLVGLTLRRDAHGERTRIAQTIGISLAIFGTLVMQGGFLLAFPQPGSLLIIAAADALILTLVARRFAVELLHLPAAACLTIAALLGFHLATDRLAWAMTDTARLFDALISPASGQVLIALFVVLLAAAERFAANEKLARRSYYIVAGSIAVVSLTLLTSFGFGVAGDPYYVSLAYIIYAAGALWCAWREEIAALTWAASALLLAAFAQTFAAWFVIPYTLQAALLAHASVTLALGIAARERAGLLGIDAAKRVGLLRTPLVISSIITSALAAVMSVVAATELVTSAAHAALALWLAGLWLVVALFERKRGFLLSLSRRARTRCNARSRGGIASLRVARGERTRSVAAPVEFASARRGARAAESRVVRRATGDAHHAIEGGRCAIGTPSLALRLVQAWREFTGARWSVDHATTGLVLAGFVLLAVIGVTPGVVGELTRVGLASLSWDVAGAPHSLIGGAGAWVVFALLLVTLFANARERFHRGFVYAAIFLVASACPLLAMRWESATLTASAWRWYAVVLLVTGVLVSWTSGAAKLVRRLEPEIETNASPSRKPVV
jgi:hypothetical protein